MSKVFFDCAIPEILKAYFTKMGIEICSDWKESDFVIVKENTAKKFGDKGIIALDSPENWQGFIQNNGRLVFDTGLLDSGVGEKILNRFFNKEGSSLFEENFQGWNKKDSFNISNFFSTGEYLDKVVIEAAEIGAPALEVKSALGHSLTMLSSLEEEGIIGLPIEVSYGNSESSFAIQIHGNGRISKDDIESLLSPKLSRNLKFNSLVSTLFSCDLLEITSLESSAKFTLTLNWFEEEKNQLPSLLLNIAHRPLETELVVEEASIDPLLIQGEDLILDSVTISGEDIEDEDAIRIEGVTEIFKDESILIEDHTELENFVFKVKGKFEDIGEKTTLIKGEKLDLDEVVYRIAGNVEEVIKENKLDVRPLEKRITQKIKSKLNEFSQSINVPAEDLTLEEIARFQVQKMPEIIKQELKTSVGSESSEVNVLKDRVRELKAEIKALQDSQKTIEKIHQKSDKNHEDSESISIRDVVYGAKGKNSISDEEIENIRQQIEKEMEKRIRRFEIEASKKEATFARELQKAKHQSRLKDIVVSKTKESYSRVLKKKDEELTALKQKTDQLSSAAVLNSVSPISTKLKEAEKLNLNLQKQVDFYKAQVSQLATTLNSSKNDSQSTEELRQIKAINQKLKTMYNSLKDENEKLKHGVHSALSSTTEISGSTDSSSGEAELKRFRALNQQLENELKDSAQKIISLEAKMVELSRQLRAGSSDDASKVRIGHLEASVKKLTQDTIEAKNQVNEAKKEVNRLRQEKTFLQNQLDKLKKQADKAKNNSSKKAA